MCYFWSSFIVLQLCMNIQNQMTINLVYGNNLEMFYMAIIILTETSHNTIFENRLNHLLQTKQENNGFKQ